MGQIEISLDDKKLKYFERQKRRVGFEWKHNIADWRRVAEFILEWEGAQPESQKIPPKTPGLGNQHDEESIPNGMNQWLESLAKEMEIQVSNLWRYRKAAQSAIQLWGDKYEIKSCNSIPKHMSPESIELVEKISRAAPSEVVNDITERLYQKAITRSELRKIWQNIRHVVKTESCNNPIYYKLPPTDIYRRDKLFEELCFEFLRKNLMEGSPSILKGCGKCYANENIKEQGLDILAMAKDENESVFYHAIVIRCTAQKKDSRPLIDLYENFDFTWILTSNIIENEQLIPSKVGIMQFTDKSFKLIRYPVQNQNPDLTIICRYLITSIIPK